MTTPAVARVKKLINRVEDLVPESLAGLGAAHPDLVKIDATNRSFSAPAVRWAESVLGSRSLCETPAVRSLGIWRRGGWSPRT
jgi:hypothetical protein